VNGLQQGGAVNGRLDQRFVLFSSLPQQFLSRYPKSTSSSPPRWLPNFVAMSPAQTTDHPDLLIPSPAAFCQQPTDRHFTAPCLVPSVPLPEG
jgi:hypothetical protein